jgi:hypothetical protein
MPAHARRQESGVFNPADLDLIDRVLKKLRSDELGEEKRRHLVQRVMANYMAGMTDEDELVEFSRRPLGR